MNESLQDFASCGQDKAPKTFNKHYNSAHSLELLTPGSSIQMRKSSVSLTCANGNLQYTDFIVTEGFPSFTR
jgi:hypothetical protein